MSIRPWNGCTVCGAPSKFMCSCRPSFVLPNDSDGIPPAAPTEAPDWAKRANDYADEGFAFLRDKPTEAPALSREHGVCQLHDAPEPCKTCAELRIWPNTIEPPAQKSCPTCAQPEFCREEKVCNYEPPAQGSAELVDLIGTLRVIADEIEGPAYDMVSWADLIRQAATALSRQPSQQGPTPHIYGMGDAQPVELGDVRPYLKDGETVAECIARNRKDTDIVLGEFAKERLKCERLERQLTISQQGPSEEEVALAQERQNVSGPVGEVSRAILRWAEQSGRRK